MASMKFACVVVVMCMVVLSAPMAEAGMTCGRVIRALDSYCDQYLRSGLGPASPCCNEMRRLFAAARTTPDRRKTCVCLKHVIYGYGLKQQTNAAELPLKCSVHIPYKISTSTNCDTVKF